MTVTLLLDMAADAMPDRVLVGSRVDGITAAAFRDHALGGSGIIARATGEEPVDAVLYLATNGPCFPVSLFAAAYAGVPLVPLNYRLGEEQLQALAAQHPHALVIGDEARVESARQTGQVAFTPAEFLASAGATPVSDARIVTEPTAPAAIIYTSGTTSAPKGVILRHSNLVSYVIGTVEFASAGADEAALMSVPPYHIAAVSNCLTNLYAGRRVVVLESFSPDGWLSAVRVEGITSAMVVPTMLARLMQVPQSDKAVPTLRALAYGGAAMPRPVIETALKAWPQVDFVNAYGLTETSSTITLLGPEEHRAASMSSDAAVRQRLASAGRPVPGVEVEIRNAEGLALGPGEAGRIWVRGSQVAGEYTGRGRTVDDDGWFDTRDRGRLDAEGYLFIEGREDDTIIRGAENIAPAEIEDVLLRDPDVVDAAVVGVPDREWGHRIEAVVVARPGVELASDHLEQIRARVRMTLRSSKTPDRIVVWPDIPRTPTGKLVRRDIVSALEADR